MEQTEKITQELDRTIKITQFEKQREENIKRTSMTYRTITEDLTFMLSECKKEKKKGGTENLKKIMAENFSKFGKSHKTTDLGNWVNTRVWTQRIQYRNISKSNIWKLKTKITCESSKRETSFLQRKNNLNNSRFLMKNNGGQKVMVRHFSSAERKELSVQNSISSETIFF